MRVLFGLTVLLAAAACAPTPTPPRPLAIFNIKDSADGVGGYITRPTAVFLAASNLSLSDSHYPAEACQDIPYVPPDTTTATLTDQLDAGSPILVATNVTTGQMIPDTIPGRLIVYKTQGAPLAFSLGADVTFTVPGAASGFPASTLAALTAKRLVLGPIASNPPDSLHLTWTPGSPGIAAVQIELIYMSPNSTVYDKEIQCSMNDDGDFYVPGPNTPDNMSAKWAAASNTAQRVHAFRWVTTFKTLGDAGLLYSVGQFDTTKTSFP